MIKFELAKLNGQNSDGAMVYLPGQDYVMFNGLKIQLDRVLCANENWIGCVFCQSNRINFIERQKLSGRNNLIIHSAEILSSAATTRTARSATGQSNDGIEHRISSLRIKQAATLLKAVRHAAESVDYVMNLVEWFDQEADEEFAGFDQAAARDSAKLGIVDMLHKRKGTVSLHAIGKTLRTIEDESIEIMHEELDISPVTVKPLRH